MLTPQLIALLSLALAACMAVYNIFFVPSRADRAALLERVKNLEVHDANHEARLAGFSVQMERNQDRLEERCAKIETEVNQVSRLREDVAVVKAKLEGQGDAITEMKATLKEIFNLLRVSKN